MSKVGLLIAAVRKRTKINKDQPVGFPQVAVTALQTCKGFSSISFFVHKNTNIYRELTEAGLFLHVCLDRPLDSSCVLLLLLGTSSSDPYSCNSVYIYSHQQTKLRCVIIFLFHVVITLLINNLLHIVWDQGKRFEQDFIRCAVWFIVYNQGL